MNNEQQTINEDRVGKCVFIINQSNSCAALHRNLPA